MAGLLGRVGLDAADPVGVRGADAGHEGLEGLGPGSNGGAFLDGTN